MKRYLLILPAMLIASIGFGQDFWSPVAETALSQNPFASRTRPSDFRLFRLNENGMKAALQNAPFETQVAARSSSFILTIPNEEGQPEQFRIVEAPVKQPGLAAKFPGRRSYGGVSLSDPATTIRFSYGKFGFNGVILNTSKGIRFIERINREDNLYVVGLQSGVPGEDFICKSIASAALRTTAGNMYLKNADDSKLRIYRAAVATNWQFSQAFSDEADTEAERKADVMEELEEQMAIVNAIFERDFGVRLVLIDNNEDIIFLDDASDPFPNGNPDDTDPINAQTQTTITDEIGSSNFDVGHLVRISGGTSSYGSAGGIGTVCNDATKSRAFTTRQNWDALGVYSEIMFTHEFAHQCGANHVFTHQDDNDNAQLEPGSGSTIMSYGGGSAPEEYWVVNLRDQYFAAINIQQVTDYLKGQGCGNAMGISNLPPTAGAGIDYTIPRSTPFILTGTSSDPENGGLTHTWEQMDKLTDAADFPWVPTQTHTKGPEFRSRPPVPEKFRVFPTLANVLDGTNTNKWEKLPSVTRDLNFRFTVRDNAPFNGQNKSDDMVVHVDGDIGPFSITSPNGGEQWCPGSKTITWSVNGSEALAANVKISLSTNGGLSFPTVLVASTPNDGSHTLTFPCVVSTQARIKIEGIGNIFFDISDGNFTGDVTDPTFTAPPDVTIYKDADCNYDVSVGITGDVTDEDDNCDNTLDAIASDGIAAGTCDGETVITRTWTLTDECGNSTVKIQKITIADTTRPTFTVPADITIYKDATCGHDASVAVTGDVTDEDDNCDNSLDATFDDDVADGSCVGEEIITRTWTLEDDCGNSVSYNQVIIVKDTTRPVISNVEADPSSLWPPNHKMVLVTINYDVADNCSPPDSITNVLSVTSNEPANGTGDGDTDTDWIVVDEHHVWLRAERAGNGDGRIYTVTITSTDDCGNVATTTVPVYVVHNITGPNSGKSFKVGSTVAFSGVFWDQPGKVHTAKWIFDDNLQTNGRVTEPRGSTNGTVTGSFKFTTPGVYKVRMNITDQLGNTSYATTNGDLEEIVVIYDPSGGYAYGGGWFHSQAGALTANPAAIGKASFGVIANHFKNSTNPKGESQFKFQVGDFEFNALNFEYLSIAGAKAQVKGSGKILGGQSGINFIMTVLDGDVAESGGVDRIRMKIFNKNTGYVYYDNQPGASDADIPVTAVGDNSVIVVQGAKGNANSNQSYYTSTPATDEVQKDLMAKVMPNPTNDRFTILLGSEYSSEKIVLSVADMFGRIIEERTVYGSSSIIIGSNYKTGVYFVNITRGKRQQILKLIKL